MKPSWLSGNGLSLDHRGLVADINGNVVDINFPDDIDEKVVAGCPVYMKKIKKMCATGRSLKSIFRSLQIHEAQGLARKLGPIYRQSLGVDGYVIFELSNTPGASTGTITREAFYTWRRLASPNTMINIPASDNHIPAIKKLSSAGINTSVYGIFNHNRYREVAEAYIAGLEEKFALGERLDQLASVVFVELSALDRLFNPILIAIAAGDTADAAVARQLTGKVAIASAIIIDSLHKELFNTERFKRLTVLGANPQRIVWVNNDIAPAPIDSLTHFSDPPFTETIIPLLPDLLKKYNLQNKKQPVLIAAEKTLELLQKELNLNVACLLRNQEAIIFDRRHRRYEHIMNILSEKVEGILSAPVNYKTTDFSSYTTY